MTEKAEHSKLVKDVKAFIEDWMALSDLEKAQVKGYVDCLRSVAQQSPGSRRQRRRQERRE